MNFYTLSLFPNLIKSSLEEGVIKKAIIKKYINIVNYDLRKFGIGKNKQLDDTNYGGGPGMILKPEPIFNGVEYIKEKHNIKSCPIILMSPQGKVLKQDVVKHFVSDENLIIISGRYEGVDERVVSDLITHEISIGDYVLSGGELPTAIFIEVLSRMAPGVLGNENSLSEESFSKSQIKYPVYTKPKNFRGMNVPEILLSGDHKKIDIWRSERSKLNTKLKRPDLI
ncbi:MAG: tRNA (guanosine(37)-N1)-methyltransferase TrmD [Dehalococcoidia bacterium]